jgi:hypothetical protein
MRYIDSIAITSTMMTQGGGTVPGTLVYTDASDAGEPAAWSGSVTYAIGAYASFNYRKYISRVANNLNNWPSVSPTQWLDAGPINSRAMFDESTSTQTNGGSSLNVQIGFNAIANAVALLNIDATDIQVRMSAIVNGVSTYVYDTGVVSLIDNDPVVDWYEWLFSPQQYKRDIVFTDLPAYSDGIIQVLLNHATGSVKVGHMAAGRISALGQADYGASVGIVDFSTIKTNDFGDRTYTQRGFARTMSVPITINRTDRNSVTRRLEDLRGKPVVWIAAEEISATIVYGPFKSFDHVITTWGYSRMQLEIQGLK